LSIRANKITTTHVTEEHNNGEEDKGVGASGINGVKLSFALASAKLHLSPHVLFS
jgi:hypothetical protein